MAMGGTFQDGFIGSAIGAGVTSALGAMPGMSALEGKGVLKVIGRTAVAAISGGTASVLAGGKFADGAYSAAFFHLFNHESSVLRDAFQRPANTRKLSEGERAMAMSVFGDALNLDAIEVRYKNAIPMQDASTFVTPNGHVYIPKYYRLVRDFSAVDLDMDLKATFIHELMHVYQYQNGMAVKIRGLFSWAVSYEYTWDTHKSFGSYRMEQQATIVGDYFLRKNGLGARWNGKQIIKLWSLEQYESKIPWKKN